MAKKRKRKVKFGRILILLLIVCLLAYLGVLAYEKINVKEVKTKKVKNISTIKEYDYVLKENAFAYYKKLFKKLDSVLSKEDVDEEEYLELVDNLCNTIRTLNKQYKLDYEKDWSNMVITIKDDVGGVQFVYKNYQSDFEKFAMDSVYKIVESNVYGNRRQNLPIVEEVKCNKVKNETFKYNDSSDENAYVMNFDIKYKEDLGYQTEGSLIVIHSGKKLEVAAMSNDKNV